MADAAYVCRWTSSFEALQYKKQYSRGNHKVKYLILMIMVRAQRPILLTGGPFYVLSLETFKSVSYIISLHVQYFFHLISESNFFCWE